MRQLLAIIACLAVASSLSAAADAQNSCQGLSSLHLENTTITSAEVVAAGTFTPPAGQQGSGCHGVQAASRPFAESAPTFAPQKIRTSKLKCGCPPQDGTENIRDRATAALPEAIDYAALASAVSRGYASAATDTGHAGEATDAILGPGPSRENR